MQTRTPSAWLVRTFETVALSASLISGAPAVLAAPCDDKLACVEIAASKDGSIFKDAPTASSGLLVAGQAADDPAQFGLNPTPIRRGLIRFSLDELPPDAMITSATLSLCVQKVPEANAFGPVVNPATFRLRRLKQDWGESNYTNMPMKKVAGGCCLTKQNGNNWISDLGDATWRSAKRGGSNWQNGGNFVSAVSSTRAFDGRGCSSFSGLDEDVQGWLDGDFGNFGWILSGQEGDNGYKSARLFFNRESAQSGPLLRVEYAPEPASELVLSAALLSLLLLRSQHGPGRRSLNQPARRGSIGRVGQLARTTGASVFTRVAAPVDRVGWSAPTI